MDAVLQRVLRRSAAGRSRSRPRAAARSQASNYTY
jgi:hypothetical protein